MDSVSDSDFLQPINIENTNSSFLQLAAIGAINRELDNEHLLTHFSQNPRKIKLNQIVNLGISDDLVENIYLLFPEKYNDFCNHPDYPLNCVKSITVQVMSEITEQTCKIIYYPCSNYSLFYNKLEYTSIKDDKSIFIPKNFTYNEDKGVFVGSFFHKQRTIICPLKIKSKTHQIKVSIQRWEETLLSLNHQNNVNHININNHQNNGNHHNHINNYINSNIKNIINLYVSDPIHLKPIPIPYMGSALFNRNTIIPDHIPKSESLDDVSIDLMLEDRKLWSDYNLMTISFPHNNSHDFYYTFDKNKYDKFSSHLFFVREMDLNNIEKFVLTINHQIICDYSGIWLQTRYEEYKNNIGDGKNFLIDGFILLPIPPIYNKNIQNYDLIFMIKIKNPLKDIPVVTFKSKKDQDNHFVPEDTCMSAIFRLENRNCINYCNESSSELYINCNNLLCQLWGIMTYKDNICTTSSPHPFLKLQFSLCDMIILKETPDYYHQIVPLSFGQPVTQKYLVYRMIFQNTPLSFSHPVAKNPYEPAKFISNRYYHSTLNANKIQNIQIKVFWDEEVIRQHYPETDQLKLYFFSESYNVLQSIGFGLMFFP